MLPRPPMPRSLLVPRYVASDDLPFPSVTVFAFQPSAAGLEGALAGLLVERGCVAVALAAAFVVVLFSVGMVRDGVASWKKVPENIDALFASIVARQSVATSSRTCVKFERARVGFTGCAPASSTCAACRRVMAGDEMMSRRSRYSVETQVPYSAHAS